MARRDVAPTKSNLLALKRELGFAREGFDLLDEKRQILLLELMRYVERARRLQRETDEAVADAFDRVRSAVLAAGRRSMAAFAEAVPVSDALDVRSHRLMGIDLPTVSCEAAHVEPRHGLAVSSVHTDALHKTFAQLLPLLAQLAEVENAVVRLARELKRTLRRVNALEKLFIPDTEETITHIAGALEDREREALGIMRIVKQRIETAREAAYAAQRGRAVSRGESDVQASADS